MHPPQAPAITEIQHTPTRLLRSRRVRSLHVAKHFDPTVVCERLFDREREPACVVCLCFFLCSISVYNVEIHSVDARELLHDPAALHRPVMDFVVKL